MFLFSLLLVVFIKLLCIFLYNFILSKNIYGNSWLFMVLAENPSNILDKNYTIFCAATTCNNYLTITIAQVNYFTKKYKKKN